jgi:hypothetical protein
MSALTSRSQGELPRWPGCSELTVFVASLARI